MVMASARVMRAASRLPQRGSRCWPTVLLIAAAVRCLAAAGRERKASVSAAKLLARGAAARSLGWMPETRSPIAVVASARACARPMSG